MCSILWAWLSRPTYSADIFFIVGGTSHWRISRYFLFLLHTLQIFTPWKLQGLEIAGSMQGKSAAPKIITGFPCMDSAISSPRSFQGVFIQKKIAVFLIIVEYDRPRAALPFKEFCNTNCLKNSWNRLFIKTFRFRTTNHEMKGRSLLHNLKMLEPGWH